MNNNEGATINIGIDGTNGNLHNYYDGTVNNYGLINNKFVFNNYSGGVVNNFGDLKNHRQVNNHSTFNNGGNVINICPGEVKGTGIISGNSPIDECTFTTELPPNLEGEITTDIDGNTVITVEDVSGGSTEITLPPGSITDGDTIEIDVQTTGQNTAAEFSGSSVPYPPGKTIKITTNPGSSKVCIVDSPESVLATGLPNCGSTDISQSTIVLDCDEQTYSFTGFPNSPTDREYKCNKVSESGETFMVVEGLANSFVWPGSSPEIQEISTVSVVMAGTPIIATGQFSDADEIDFHIAEWNWDDGTTTPGFVDPISKSVFDEHVFTGPGIYTLELTVTDEDGRNNSKNSQFIAVFDPEGGYVTGGGWIDSPQGSYVVDETLEGKATFGFVSKYKKGQSEPVEQTEFQFKVADLKFHSDTYDWLVVAGHKAMFKGTGTINGSGHYGFMLFAVDENLTPSTDVDLFRIQIWNKDNGDAIVYDNEIGVDEDVDPTTEIGGGSIVIHTGKGKPS